MKRIIFSSIALLLSASAAYANWTCMNMPQSMNPNFARQFAVYGAADKTYAEQMCGQGNVKETSAQWPHSSGIELGPRGSISSNVG